MTTKPTPKRPVCPQVGDLVRNKDGVLVRLTDGTERLSEEDLELYNDLVDWCHGIDNGVVLE